MLLGCLLGVLLAIAAWIALCVLNEIEASDNLASLGAALAVGVFTGAGSVILSLWLNVRSIAASDVKPFSLRHRKRTPRLEDRPETQSNEAETKSIRNELAEVRKQWRDVKRSLTRLKYSYRDLYQNAPVMYFSLDMNGMIVTCNDTLIQTLGYERRYLHGKNYSLLLATPDRAVLVGGESESQWRRKDGTVIDVWLHTVPVHDEAGHFVRYRSAALDLTEKNRLANELRARGDELERTNQRLRTINSELEAFTHVVSHDLKEPLRTLQAYSHILAEEHGAQLGADGFQYINHLIRASRRLGLLIDELLNLSHAGRVTQHRVFNLLEVVATVRQDLVDLIQRKHAVILTEGSLPDVIADTVGVTQLLTNLVGNGLKYNISTEPRVVLRAAVCSDDPSRITVAVRDNGIGIDPAFHQQIFGIFRRLHQADEFEGTGAGLAICKKIVEAHGGRIWVESTLGEGATFYFTLPRYVPNKFVPAKVSNERSEESPIAIRNRTTHVANGKASSPRIVLVEDQPEVAMIIQKLGKRDGLAITWFGTAEDAWQHLRENPPDLLLLDVNLPGMNGVELCQHLRRLEEWKNVPVAMFAPDQEPELLEEYRKAGADFFLTKDLLCKPVDWQRKILELVQQIRQPLT